MDIKNRKNSRSHFENLSKHKLLKCKRSQAHIEMIISFVIFVGFVFALLVFFAPIKQNPVNYAMLDRSQDLMIKYFSEDYQVVSIILNYTAPICFSIENDPSKTGNILVKDSRDRKLSATRTDSRIYIQSSDDRYYKLYFASFLTSSPWSDTGACSDNTFSEGIDYSKAVVSTESAILASKIYDLDAIYAQSYDYLKSAIGLNNDFEFVVYNSSYGVIKNSSLSVHKVKTFPVLSRDIPLKVMDTNGNYEDLILNIRVWK